jgi:undecaprenyl diphosphate synthase
MSIWVKDKLKEDFLIEAKIPRHIAIIMDGNGRWAKKHKMPRSAGHQQGVEAIRDVIRTASDLKISMMTLFAFSTENWKRPADEVSFLMKLLVEYLKKEIDELHSRGVVIQTIGDLSGFSDQVRNEIIHAKEKTCGNQGLIMNIALNYGSRNEITRAVMQMIRESQLSTFRQDQVNEEWVQSFLDTRNMPDPDLLIRTSGEKRISNFLLWQIAYTELYFTDILWPDFRGKHLIEAIRDYQRRQRRYGGLS